MTRRSLYIGEPLRRTRAMPRHTPISATSSRLQAGMPMRFKNLKKLWVAQTT